MPLADLRILSQSEITDLLSTAEKPAEKVNIVINNILIKHVMAMKSASDDMKQKFMMSLAEIIYGEEKMISTRRLGRVMLYMSLLFDIVSGPKQAQYMMGSLFAMGGLLKIEARNYLETKRKYDPKFKIVSPLIEENKTQEDAM